jgi:hypothetical protein
MGEQEIARLDKSCRRHTRSFRKFGFSPRNHNASEPCSRGISRKADAWSFARVLSIAIMRLTTTFVCIRTHRELMLNLVANG